ncbi:uncharacterized protein B0J16DRAFT_400214 [Fusarium flagelliforme]|uniref:uncharacterized protein n=1 Tax=Fusarium flagelliforme TaxID=2675880 RepID=UPI001E8D82C9|nr:uncharacterized protein B0J16DRAFT_400214 [Fusarium flagelliforme]KAH7186205.1 hypothetical protein B0J16DRAFT_400214 [Fusarium flagelliforme]
MELFNTSQALVIALIVLGTLLVAQAKDVYHSRTYRVQGVPIEWDKERLRSFLVEAGVSATPVIQSLARESHNRSSTATVVFQDSPTILQVQLPEVFAVSTPKRPMYLELDTQFLGLTKLYSPMPDDHQIYIIAIPGLGGHALGSFKERNGEHVWLRDSLPFDVTKNDHDRPISRVMTYGYESSLADSDNVQTLEDLSIGFIEVLSRLSRLSGRKPMFIVAHSLGGLIIKQTLIDLERSNREDYKSLAEMIAAIFFFGVPHDGMDIEALIPMVGDGPNRFLLESINRLNTQVLNNQQRDFREFGLGGSREIVCFYEIVKSPTAQEGPKGTWSLTGPPALLVTKSSATMDHRQDLICAIARTHQNMVKFKAHDPEYNRSRSGVMASYT